MANSKLTFITEFIDRLTEPGDLDRNARRMSNQHRTMGLRGAQ